MQNYISPHFYYWLDDEEKRIRKEYAEKRSEINNDALIAGFDGNSLIGSKAAEVSDQYRASYTDEEAAVKQFRDDAVKHETERLASIERERILQKQLGWIR